MPTYEYLCSSCGKTFEAVQKISEDALTDCLLCGSSGEVRRLISGTAFHLKGTGWYKTDYASSNGSGSGKSSGSESSGAGTASTKS